MKPRIINDKLIYLWTLLCWLYFACVVLFVSKSPPNGFWAFSFWDNISFAIKAVVLSAAAMLFLFMDFKYGVKFIKPIKLGYFKIFAIAFVVFWLFRENKYWGDSKYTINILEGACPVDPFGIYFWKEPLDRLLTVWFYKISKFIFGWGAAKSIALMNSFIGAVFVAVLAKFSKILSNVENDRLFILLLTISGGAVQLFFGHIENYTLVSLFILLFLYFGVRYIEEKVCLYKAVLASALAVSAHGLAIFLFPPLLFLFALKNDRSWGRHTLKISKALLPGIIYLLGFYAFCRFLGAQGLPIGINRFADNQHLFLNLHEVFCVAHLWAVLQNYLLILPVGIFVLMPFVFMRIFTKGEKDLIAIFFAINAVSFLFYSLFFHNTLDRWQDWDLFAPSAFPTVFFFGYVFLKLRAGRSKNILFYSVLGMSFVFSLFWVISNCVAR